MWLMCTCLNKLTVFHGLSPTLLVFNHSDKLEHVNSKMLVWKCIGMSCLNTLVPRLSPSRHCLTFAEHVCKRWMNAKRPQRCFKSDKGDDRQTCLLIEGKFFKVGIRQNKQQKYFILISDIKYIVIIIWFLRNWLLFFFFFLHFGADIYVFVAQNYGM